MIPLNKPFLPPKNEFEEYVAGIWNRNWLTNHGPLVQEFEQKVSEYLDVSRMIFVTNGTTALQIAIKALGLDGEIITTPYSYVATTSSIVWQHCVPVFVDIDPDSFNIDPTKIEDSITKKTSAILATHIYGNPCEVEKIQEIAEKNNLKVIYDAAHCFGVTYKDRSIFEWGDISITSFHATKVFHTVEGGGLFTDDENLYQEIKYLMNFGHDGPYTFKVAGINGKNNEFNAAMGLCNLKYADDCMGKRKELAAHYDKGLEALPIKKPRINRHSSWNYAYYPILLETEQQREKLATALDQENIESRSYFRPSLQYLPFVESGTLKISTSISNRVLCLPFFFDLTFEQIDEVVRVITSSI